MNQLQQIQKELKPWVAHNFGPRPSWQPLLGVQEEVGELSHHFLKREQKIRSNENHTEEIKDAVADTMIYLMDFCNCEGIDLSSILQETWDKVKKRDWKKNVEKGI